MARTSGRARRLTLVAAAFGVVLAVEHQAAADGPRGSARIGVALPVGSPQSDDFGVGGTGALSFELPLVSILEAQAELGSIFLAPQDSRRSLGTVTYGGLGPRIRVKGFWAGAQAGFAFSGSDARFGMGGALGYEFYLVNGRVGIGPYLGYNHVLEPGTAPKESDAHLFSGGITVSFGGAAKKEAPPPPPAIEDADGDGIPDSEDACPTVKGVHTNDLNTNGCPPKDTDHDGVPDDEDACPNLPGERRADPRMNGCPDKLPPKEQPDGDLDGDGIPDSVDACPQEPGKPSDDPKKNGCPPKADLELD